MNPGDIPLIVRPDDGERYEVIADPRDIMQWERIGPRNTLRKILENPSSEDYYSLAHIAIKRQRLRDVPSWSEFLATHIVVLSPNAAISAGLERGELAAILDKAMSHAEATSETVADTVMDYMEIVQERALGPSKPAL
jgi:hypothetical protein